MNNTKKMTTEKIIRDYFNLPKRITKKFINDVLGIEGGKKKDLINYLRNIFILQVGKTPIKYQKDIDIEKNKQYYVYDNETKDIALLNKNKPLIYQSFNINPNIIPQENLISNNIIFKSIIPQDQPLNLFIVWSAELLWSGDENDPNNWYERKGEFQETLSSNQIKNNVMMMIESNFSNPSKIRNLEIVVRSVKTNQEFKLKDMELKDHKPLNICNLYNEVIPNDGGKCIQKYMTKIYPKYSKKK